MEVNLYASLAAQQQLDSTHAHEVNHLAALTSMLTGISHSTSSYDDLTSAAWALMNGSNKIADNGNVCPAAMGTANIPFDSPLDQSLGSPASTRDFQESPLQDYELDLSASMDTPLFPDHGTQQTQNDNLLSGLPLFGTELSFSQSVLPTRSSTMIMPSQQQSNNNSVDTSAGAIDDFSFDAFTRNMADLNNFDQATLKDVDESQSGINALAANFVRHYARTNAINDIDVLLQGLRAAGIDVSDDTVAEILATASFAQSRSPSPSMSQGSVSPVAGSFSRSTSMSSSPNASMSPATSATDPRGNKTRSSLQLGPKSHLHASAPSRSAKRFICDTCHKHFDRQFNMRTHSMTHVLPENRDKPFACPWSDCSKPFIRKYDAERHYRSVHVKRGEFATQEQIEKAFSGENGIPAPSSMMNADIYQANG